MLVAAAQDAPLLDTGSDLLSWNAEADVLTQVTLDDLYPGAVGLPLGRSKAMSVAAVAKARHLITGKIAGFPLVCMTGHAPTPRPPAWIQQLEAGRPQVETLRWIADGLIFHGRAWLRVAERYADGRPARFELVPEHAATVDKLGRLAQAFGKDVDPADSVRIDGPHEGLLNNGQDRLREAVAFDAAAAKAADNPVPSIELHQTQGEPMTREEIDQLIELWAAARRGANGGVAYTNQAIEAKTHGLALEQLLISGRNLAAVNIARLLGLSAWAVDASIEGAGLTYNTVPARSRELIEYGLQPYMDAITGRLSMDDLLPNGTWCRFDTARLLRGDMKERAEGYAAMIAAGIYTIEECKAMEREIPLEGETE